MTQGASAAALTGGESRPVQCSYILVPSARLELAQLSPLPPQDSVSTNFTTTASLDFGWLFISVAKIPPTEQSLDSTLKNPRTRRTEDFVRNYFVGIWAAPSAPAAGAWPAAGAGTSPAAPEAAGAGAVMGAAPSSTLPELTGRALLR